MTQLLTLTLSSSSMTSFLNGKPLPVPPTSKAASASAKMPAVKEAPTKATARKREPLSADKVHYANGVNTETQDTPKSDTQPQSENTEKEESAEKSRSHDRIQNPPNVTVEPSADDPDYVPFSNVAGAKKGKKKKKKSAMANAANPHHVKNCKRRHEGSKLKLMLR